MCTEPGCDISLNDAAQCLASSPKINGGRPCSSLIGTTQRRKHFAGCLESTGPNAKSDGGGVWGRRRVGV